MSSNMSSTNSRYEEAAQKYNEALNQYTGNAGYQNSLAQAQKGAGVESVQAGNRAQTQARSAGMSKAAAALLGANNASNSYLSSFNNQQQNATNMGYQNAAGKGQIASNQMQEGQNAYNRAWGNVGTIANMAGSAVQGIGTIAALASDGRLKHYKDVSSKLHSPVSFKSLVVEIKKHD